MERHLLTELLKEFAEVKEVVYTGWRWPVICAVLTTICIYQALELRSYSLAFDSKLTTFKNDVQKLEQELLFRKQVDFETGQQLKTIRDGNEKLLRTFLKLFPVHGERMIKDD